MSGVFEREVAGVVTTSKGVRLVGYWDGTFESSDGGRIAAKAAMLHNSLPRGPQYGFPVWGAMDQIAKEYGGELRKTNPPSDRHGEDIVY